MQCSQCGAQAPESARFCKKCGSTLPPQHLNPPEPPIPPKKYKPFIPKEQRRKIVYGTLSVLSLIFAISSAVIFIIIFISYHASSATSLNMYLSADSDQDTLYALGFALYCFCTPLSVALGIICIHQKDTRNPLAWAGICLGLFEQLFEIWFIISSMIKR